MREPGLYLGPTGPGVYMPVDNGLTAANYDPMMVGTTATALTKGQVLASVIHRVPGAVSNVHLFVNTIGVTLTANQNLIGVWSMGGVLLGKSADQSAAWVLAGGGPKVAAITAEPGQSLVQSDVIVGVLLNGTTAPSFYRNVAASGSLVSLNQTSPALRSGISSATGLTALPDPLGAMVGAAFTIWFGVS